MSLGRSGMHRAIPIAATCSVALHLTALVLSQYLLDGAADPSIASRVLVLTMDLSQTAQNEPELPFDDAPRIDPPSGSETEVSAGSADATLDVRAAAPDVTPTDTVAADTPAEVGVSAADAKMERLATPAESPSEAPRTDDEAGHESVEYLATMSASEQSLPEALVAPSSVPESEPVSPRQLEMLERKIQKWTGKLDEKKVTGIPWKHQGQEYVAKFTPLPAADDVGIEHVMVEISTERGGKKLSTEMRMKRLAFSNYAQFVDRWDPEVGLHDDELDGRFHSNSEITLLKDRQAVPTFLGKVTTAAHSVNFGDKPGYVPRDRIFQGGLETGVGSIQFPERFVPFPADAGVNEDRVRRFDADTRITFHADGSYSWQSIDASPSAEQTAVISDDATYLIAAPKAELHVRGTVNGKVLLYSPDRVIIEGNLVYAQDPAVTPDADDYLGIVSDRYVEIAPADVTGPGDLTIDAAIYARRCFTVKGYGRGNDGLLSIYGSLTAGSLSATEPRYRTKIQFDRRLEKLRPPAFPMTDRYEVESWDGVWKVEEPKATL